MSARVIRFVRIGFLALGLLLGVRAARAQPSAGYFGGPCQPDQIAFGSFLMVCSDAGTFRYALHEDVPPAPDGGSPARPSWYPRLAEVLRAQDPPACPASGRVTFTSPVVRPEDLLTIVPQGMLIWDHVTPIDHGYIGVKPLARPRASRTEADYVRVTAPADAEVIEISSLGSPTSTATQDAVSRTSAPQPHRCAAAPSKARTATAGVTSRLSRTRSRRRAGFFPSAGGRMNSAIRCSICSTLRRSSPSRQSSRQRRAPSSIVFTAG